MRLFSIFFCIHGIVFLCGSDKILTQAIIEKSSFRPNIVWLVAEDMSPTIPAFGDSTIATPTLDRLSSEGVVYENFYAPHPVCAPARASIITGMYANGIGASHMRTGPWFMENPPKQVLDILKNSWPEGIPMYEAIPPVNVKMFTEYLRVQGYYCTNNAKLDYQFKMTPTAWDESSNAAHWRNRPTGKPFFAVFNFNVTHESQIWSKSNDSLLIDSLTEIPIPPYLPATEIGRRDVRRMYSNIIEMDQQVGKIIQQLEEDNLLDSTIIMWYTDHGGPLPRQKRLLYDSGIKVPLIIRFPNASDRGTRDDRMISFIDLAPTILSLAGIEPGDHFDGTAFLGKYKRKKEPQYVFGAADRFDEKTDRVRSVRDKRYKYIKYHHPEKPMFLNVSYRNQMAIMQELIRLRDEQKLTPDQALWFRKDKPHEELFDTWEDPYELNNLALDDNYKEILLKLRSACSQWTHEINDTGLKDERKLIKYLWPDGSQPITSLPEIYYEGEIVSITCNTEGASIGYKLIKGKHEPKSWNIYNKPIKVSSGTKIKAIAHRIGYKRSSEKIIDINK